MTKTYPESAAYYGNLSRVAIGFYVKNGNPAELDAAYWYARYAARRADREGPRRTARLIQEFTGGYHVKIDGGPVVLFSTTLAKAQTWADRLGYTLR